MINDGAVIGNDNLPCVWFEHNPTDETILELWIDGSAIQGIKLTKQDIENLRDLCTYILDDHSFGGIVDNG